MHAMIKSLIICCLLKDYCLPIFVSHYQIILFTDHSATKKKQKKTFASPNFASPTFASPTFALPNEQSRRSNKSTCNSVSTCDDMSTCCDDMSTCCNNKSTCCDDLCLQKQLNDVISC